MRFSNHLELRFRGFWQHSIIIINKERERWNGRLSVPERDAKYYISKSRTIELCIRSLMRFYMYVDTDFVGMEDKQIRIPKSRIPFEIHSGPSSVSNWRLVAINSATALLRRRIRRERHIAFPLFDQLNLFPRSFSRLVK